MRCVWAAKVLRAIHRAGFTCRFRRLKPIEPHLKIQGDSSKLWYTWSVASVTQWRI